MVTQTATCKRVSAKVIIDNNFIIIYVIFDECIGYKTSTTCNEYRFVLHNKSIENLVFGQYDLSDHHLIFRKAELPDLPGRRSKHVGIHESNHVYIS